MITEKSKTTSVKSVNLLSTSKYAGDCLECAARVSVCGRPFTADLTCPRCGAVNAYENSLQPVRVKQRQEKFDVIIKI